MLDQPQLDLSITKDLASLRRGHVGRQNATAALAAIGDDVK